MERPIQPEYKCVKPGQIFMFMEIVDLKISKQIKQWTCAGLGLDNMFMQTVSIFKFAAWIYCKNFFFTLPGLGGGIMLFF